MRPKHHMSEHIPQQVRKDKRVISTEAQEKKHKLILDVANRSVRTDADNFAFCVTLEANLIQQQEGNNVFQNLPSKTKKNTQFALMKP